MDLVSYMGKVEDVGVVVTQAKYLPPWGWGQGRGVQKIFFDQGGILLIKMGEKFFTGVVI